MIGGQTMSMNRADLAVIFKDENQDLLALRQKRYAFLETDGKFSVLKQSSKQTVTPSDLQIEVESTGIGHLIIEESNINEKELKQLGLTKAWLRDKLASQGIDNIDEVNFAQVDNTGKLYIDLYEEYESNLKIDNTDQITLAKVKKLESDLMAFYFDTNTIDGKDKFSDMHEKISNINRTYSDYVLKKSYENIKGNTKNE